ncbi:bifunctional ornithine acetyltransferase/N-acetylglutamate synthase [Candidatus Pelagibacter sp.]|nr:bifunctional ornithine acetyltransferase/N-acetylglutamate synthase [Candidatus Pelagibacter sp.]
MWESLSSNIFTVSITWNACLAHDGQDIIFTPLFLKLSDFNISLNLNMGLKSFTAYTMDLTKKYIEINADYRS